MLEHVQLNDAARPRRRLSQGRRDPVRLRPPPDVGGGRAGGCGGARAHLQGRRRGDPRGLHPRRGRRTASFRWTPRARRRAGSRPPSSTRTGFRVVAVAYRASPDAHGRVTVCRRERPGPGRLHRLPRPAEGYRRAGPPGAQRARRHGEDPHRRQRHRSPAQGLPRRRPRDRATAPGQRVDDARRRPTSRAAAEQATVFAKLAPMQKARIVQALRRAATRSASWATASTTPARCARPTSASPSTRPSTSPRNRPTSSCSRRA